MGALLKFGAFLTFEEMGNPERMVTNDEPRWMASKPGHATSRGERFAIIPAIEVSGQAHGTHLVDL